MIACVAWAQLLLSATPRGLARSSAAPPEGFASTSIREVWQRDDGAVAAGRVARTWMWGPGPFYTNYEPYAEAQEGNHLVQYFDKGRLEINNAGSDPRSAWFVTSGLLVSEMVEGRARTGEKTSLVLGAAAVPVAGDSSDAGAPSYASFAGLTGRARNRGGEQIRAQVDSRGGVTAIATPPVAVSAGKYEEATGHNWADVFWRFANDPTRPAAFDWLYTLGYPITEPYWARVTIAGTPQVVLVQLFERRALTFNPLNPAATRVEMGNVGRHYYVWRYGARSVVDFDAQYKVRIAVGPAPQRATTVDETVRLTNNTGQPLDRLVFRAVWSNWEGVFALSSMRVDGREARVRSRAGVNLEVSLPAAIAPGQSITAALGFSLKPQAVGGRSAYDPANDVLSLGDMLPTLVPWENGGWAYYPYSELGDHGYYDTADYSVEVVSTGNERLIVGGTGKITSVNPERTRWEFSAKGVRDAAYVVSPRFVDPLADASMTRRQGDTTILAYFLPQRRVQARAQLDLVAPALGWFGQKIGAYRFDTYTVAEMGVPRLRSDNYAQEYPTTYLVPTSWLAYGVTAGSWTWYTPVHEVAHQWFYSTVGSNQLVDPWLDEAVTSYATAEYVRAVFPQQYARAFAEMTAGATGRKPVSSGVYSGFANENEYSAVIYDSGVRMLDRVRQAMGDGPFYEGLREYYAKFGGKRATPGDLMGALQGRSRADLKGIFAEYLGY